MRDAGATTDQIAVVGPTSRQDRPRCVKCQAFISPRTMTCNNEGCKLFGLAGQHADAESALQYQREHPELSVWYVHSNDDSYWVVSEQEPVVEGAKVDLAKPALTSLPLSRDERQMMFDRSGVCQECGGIRPSDDDQPCPICLGSGEIDASIIPHQARWMANSRDKVTIADLAGVFSRDEDEGRLIALIRFPSLVLYLDQAGKEALWEEIRRYPDLALLGRNPDSIAAIGGLEHLAWAAQQNPTVARASLRTLPVIRQQHPDGEQIAQQIAAAGRRSEA